MTYDPDKHHRRSIRLGGYDYSQSGAYFLTICAQHQESLFGQIANSQLVMNDAGQMDQRWWDELDQKFLMNKCCYFGLHTL